MKLKLKLFWENDRLYKHRRHKDGYDTESFGDFSRLRSSLLLHSSILGSGNPIFSVFLQGNDSEISIICKIRSRFAGYTQRQELGKRLGEHNFAEIAQNWEISIIVMLSKREKKPLK